MVGVSSHPIWFSCYAGWMMPAFVLRFGIDHSIILDFVQRRWDSSAGIAPLTMSHLALAILRRMNKASPNSFRQRLSLSKPKVKETSKTVSGFPAGLLAVSSGGPSALSQGRVSFC